MYFIYFAEKNSRQKICSHAETRSKAISELEKISNNYIIEKEGLDKLKTCFLNNENKNTIRTGYLLDRARTLKILVIKGEERYPKISVINKSVVKTEGYILTSEEVVFDEIGYFSISKYDTFVWKYKKNYESAVNMLEESEQKYEQLCNKNKELNNALTDVMKKKQVILQSQRESPCVKHVRSFDSKETSISMAPVINELINCVRFLELKKANV